MVAPDEVHALRVSEFEADEEGDGFDAEEAAVDVVACGRRGGWLVGVLFWEWWECLAGWS